jgi:dihydropteroate synthase
MAHTAWHIAEGRSIALGAPRIMAIINTTPDSFSDGGDHLDPAAAADFAARAIADGAAILDIGGESTRPGAQRIDADTQITRTIPAIRAIRAAGITAPISIDTTLSTVARAALDAGAEIVNDVAAGTEDPRILTLAAERSAGIILMHRRVAPGADAYSHTLTHEPDYSVGGGIVSSVRSFLRDAARRAIDAGIAPERIVLDPGLGFGKSVAQNYTLITSTRALLDLGFPILSAASRKSFLGAITGQTVPAERIEASIAVSVAHALAGVRLFRVHDVAPHARALAVAHRIIPPDPQNHPRE